MRKTIDILGVKVDKVNFKEALEKGVAFLDGARCHMIVTPNSEIIMNAKDCPEFLEILNHADMVIPDGIGLVYASRIKRNPLEERVTGIDFLNQLIDYGDKEKKSIYLLGSKPTVAEKAAEKMLEKYPGIVVKGTHDGYFSESEEQDIVDEINALEPDILCVALGSPKQEEFIYKYQAMLKAKIAVGVGGSLDVWAGTAKRAPEIYQKLGLEWLYRFVQEPSRYKRMLALPRFIINVIMERK